jgi:hypothetical protein
MVLFQNCVWQSRSPTKMAATVQLRCYWKQLWSRWAITGSWEPLVSIDHCIACLLWFVASDYPFGIFKFFSLMGKFRGSKLCRSEVPWPFTIDIGLLHWVLAASSDLLIVVLRPQTFWLSCCVLRPSDCRAASSDLLIVVLRPQTYWLSCCVLRPSDCRAASSDLLIVVLRLQTYWLSFVVSLSCDKFI